MNSKQLERMGNAKGFIAALDQSGGSTPKALELYGINEDAYKNDEEMFALVHEMRKRIITAKAFSSERILAAILFKITMESKIDGLYTADYLWDKKGIIPILKVDEGLAPLDKGVQLMKEMKGLDALLKEAQNYHIFGTKMRSVIKELNEEGIKAVIAQQFEYAKKISSYGLVPIIEPEVDINSEKKAEIEEILKKEVLTQLENLDKDVIVMFKFTIPTKAGLYDDLVEHKNVLRVVALSGGYSREKANELLSHNKNMIASFSRALSQDLNVNQTEEEFEKALDDAISSIYKASCDK